MAGRATKGKPAKSLEQRLWDAADALRGNQEPSEYKHVVLGLVFLNYISDRFEARRLQFIEDRGGSRVTSKTGSAPNPRQPKITDASGLGVLMAIMRIQDCV